MDEYLALYRKTLYDAVAHLSSLQDEKKRENRHQHSTYDCSQASGKLLNGFAGKGERVLPKFVQSLVHPSANPFAHGLERGRERQMAEGIPLDCGRELACQGSGIGCDPGSNSDERRGKHCDESDIDHRECHRP